MKQEKSSENIDAILVLGHMIKDKTRMCRILEARIRRAEELYDIYGCGVIFSGGKRRNINEAYFMKKNTRIPNKDIMLETKSLNTKINAIFCKRIILKKKFKTVIIVTSPYHIIRAYVIFRKVLPFDIKMKMASSRERYRLVIRIELFFSEILKMLKDLYDLDFNRRYRKLNKN